MNEPYFQVGEEVILVSRLWPELNGDHVIEHRLTTGLWSNRYKPDSMVDITSPAAYKLVGLDPGVTIEGSGYFGQPSLRKKHKPSTESFHELITNTIKETT